MPARTGEISLRGSGGLTPRALRQPLKGQRRAQEIAALCGPGSYADLGDHFVVPFMG